MKPTVTKEVSADLRTLAKEINDREATIEQLKSSAINKCNEAVAEAVLQGQTLILARSKVPHGFWSDWLKSHCPNTSETVARRYVALAKHPRADELTRAGSLREALRIVDYDGGGEKHPSHREGWEPCMVGLSKIYGFVKFVKNPENSIATWPEEPRQKLAEDFLPVARVLYPNGIPQE